MCTVGDREKIQNMFATMFGIIFTAICLHCISAINILGYNQMCTVGDREKIQNMFATMFGIIFTAVCLHCISAINILGVFEIPSKSVHILGHELLLGLAKRGFNVTLMSSFPPEKQEANSNYTHIYLDGLVDFKEKNYGDHTQGESKFGMLSLINAQKNLVNLGMKTKNFQNLLKSDSKFDIIIQTYALNEAYLGLAHHFDARVIGFLPFSNFPHADDLTGNTAPYSYVPIPFGGFTQNMNFFQRTANSLAATFMRILHKFYLLPRQEEILKMYFPHAPTLWELQKERVDLLFTNVHFGIESPRPKTPNIIQIGGYHVQKPEPLQNDLKKYLDDSKNGVVFLGFGSNVKTSKIPKEKLDILVNTLGESPFDILFKYEGVLPNQPRNFKTNDWFPQRGILAHPKTKLFISHGGKSSLDESLYFGIPTLCVSFYGDQKKNCAEMAEYGYAIHLPYQQLTRDSFEKAFIALTQNPIYKEKAKFRAELFREQEMDPLDRASFWIRHVHKYKGAKHLQPKAATMPVYQYFLLDVMLLILCIVGLLSLITYKILKCLVNCISGKNKRDQR
ncbi:Glycosyltransferase, partial [Oryctes borbonicus]